MAANHRFSKPTIVALLLVVVTVLYTWRAGWARESDGVIQLPQLDIDVHSHEILDVTQELLLQGAAPTSTAHTLFSNSALLKRLINDSDDSWQQKGSPPTFKEAVEIGEYLQARIEASPTCVQQSTYKGLLELHISDWQRRESPWKQKWYQKSTFIHAMYKDLDMLPYRESENMKVTNEYSVTTKPIGQGGKVFRPTGASYSNVYAQFLVKADTNFGPEFEEKQLSPPITGKDLPDLRQWSDVAFIKWQHYCRRHPVKMRQLKGIDRTEIANKLTQSLATKALGRSGGTLNW